MIHEKTYQQEINLPKALLWDFLSKPSNLSKLSPARLDFQILNSPIPEEIYDGIIIKYRLKPIPGLPVIWQSKLIDIQEGKSFTDIQVKGPFKFWQHQHSVIEKENSCLIVDKLKYEAPLGFIGTLANKLFLSKMIDEIFKFRFQAMQSWEQETLSSENEKQ